MRIVPRGGCIAWVSETCLESITAEARRWFPLETGGVLMGYWAPNGSEVVITHSIGPGPAAKHRDSSFEPDAVYQQERIEEIYAESGRVHSYLGDWHSHPRPSEQLSRRDKRTLYRIGTHRGARTPTPIMGVMTKRRGWDLILWTAHVHRFARQLTLTRLEIRSFCLPSSRTS